MNWRNRDLRDHVGVIDGNLSPTIVLKNGTYLNVFTKQWLQGHIWIYYDRIVYVGKELPNNLEETEVVDCAHLCLVPGYIEPHAHPFQLYNPEQLALFAAQFGTTTLVNDNMFWALLLDHKKALTLLEHFNELPVSMFWWSRYDSQTLLQQEESYFNTSMIESWLTQPTVIQGGELTAWPRLLAGDDRLLYWIQKTKELNKRVEGHLPGASKRTLTKMKLLGIESDHESMTGSDVIKRLKLGYQVGLRHSSIRPDLPKLLREIRENEIQSYDRLMMTTDGSTPSFYEQGLLNVCIQIALDEGVPLIEAYCMATINIANHFGLGDTLGAIAPGHIAHINVLTAKEDPTPVSVLAKGNWIVKQGEQTKINRTIHWAKYGIQKLDIAWDLHENDMQFSTPIGLKMVNNVITEPYAITVDISVNELSKEENDAFLLLVDRHGKWRVNSLIKGFTKQLGGLASSYSTTGDFVFIGKNKADILLAWKRMKQLGGGIVLVDRGKIIFELSLSLSGMMFDGNMETLIEKEKVLKEILFEYGYPFSDPIYSIFFLSSTHLPYIRITQQGMIDVMKRETIFPAIMRDQTS